MARNRLIFEEAMKKAHNYAWDGRWAEAAREYERALAEFPDHVTAHLNLGMAYLRMGQQDKALVCYQQASQLSPDDPLPLEKIARIQEELGNREEAAATYAKLAWAWERARSSGQSLAAWQKVALLNPENAEAHGHLAEGYMRQGMADKAVAEYLIAGRICQEKGDVEEAVRYCDSALALDPYNAEARSLRETLSLGKSLQKVKSGASKVDEEQSPLSAAAQQALSRLAEIVFEEQSQEPTRDLSSFRVEGRSAAISPEASRRELITTLAHAIDYQTRGTLDQAISAYRRVLEMGADYPEIHFNLGILYYKAMGYDEAIRHFRETTEVPAYALASYFGLGRCYRAQGKLAEALESYLRLLHTLDLQSGRKSQADDLLQLYGSLTGTGGKIKDREKAAAFIDALAGFLTGKGWEQRLLKVREQIEDLARGDVMISLAEVVEVPGSDAVLSGLQRSRKYLDSKLPMAAIEECYWLLDIAPTYLPVHTHLAEIFVKQGKIEQAAAKYTAIANTYQIRGDTRQAIDIYRRMIDLFPLDVSVRPKLISLLTSRGQIDEALEEYMELANAYYQQAQLDKALEKYREALAMAPRGGSEKNWPVVIRRKMADIYAQRLDWSRASAIYQEIKNLAPSDNVVRCILIDLYYKAGQRQQAEAEVDELLLDLLRKGRAEEALKMLQGLAKAHSNEDGLRRRIANVLAELGRKDEAVAELDSLGEQQLDQGQLPEAIATIKQIIALSPHNVAAYQHLLEELESQVGGKGTD